MPRSLQEKQAKEAAAAAAAGNKGPRQSPGELRVAKGKCMQALCSVTRPVVCARHAALTSRALRTRAADISELNLGRTTTVHFPEGKEKLLNFEVTIKPEEGFYKCVPALCYAARRICALLHGGAAHIAACARCAACGCAPPRCAER